MTVRHCHRLPAPWPRRAGRTSLPYFDDLAERPLDETTIEGWLLSWSTLEELVTEAAALAMIAYTFDTARPGQGSRPPPLLHRDPAQGGGAERASWRGGWSSPGYRAPALETTLARFRTSIEIFREANVPLFAELEELSAAVPADHRVA